MGRSKKIVALVACLVGVWLLVLGPPQVFTADRTVSVGAHPGTAVLDEVVRRARAGDADAQGYVRQLDEWLHIRGLSLDAVTEEAVDDSREAGGVEFRAEGIAPLWINVYAHVDLSTSKRLSAYVSARRAALIALPPSSAGHRGRISFVDFAPIERLCDLVLDQGGSIQEAMVDVWLDGKWVTRVGSGDEEFWNRPCEEVTAGIRANLTQSHDEDELGARASDAVLTVYGSTVVIPDKAVPGILGASDVLIFDPEEDLLAYWSGKAVDVRLALPIDAFGSWVDAKVEDGSFDYPFVPSGDGGK